MFIVLIFTYVCSVCKNIQYFIAVDFIFDNKAVI